jgi:hypothetical protein
MIEIIKDLSHSFEMTTGNFKLLSYYLIRYFSKSHLFITGIEKKRVVLLSNFPALGRPLINWNYHTRIRATNFYFAFNAILSYRTRSAFIV